jgi:serine/threonine-protein kinase
MPRPLRALRGEIPEPVEEVVLRALRKEREERPPTALHLAREFEAALYAAGIELKMMGTRTPQTPFSTAPVSDVAYNTDIQNTIITGGAVAPAQKPSSPAESTSSKTAGRPAFNFLEQEEKPGTIERIKTFLDEISPAQKVLMMVAALVVIAGLVTGIILLTRSSSTPSGNPTSPPVAPAGMVYILGGKFTMGLNDSSNDFEKPEHERTVGAFFLDRNEVSVEDYYKFIKETGRKPPDKWSKDWKEGKFTYDESKLPVTNVNWHDAKAYAQWAGKRLPTEIEWEYAARGSDRRLYPWGNDFDSLRANVESDKKVLRPIGRFPQTGAGLFDMAGNAMEWTDSDSFAYPGSSAQAATGKILRGGSFLTKKNEATVVTRTVLAPDRAREDVGFRCASDIPRK